MNFNYQQKPAHHYKKSYNPLDSFVQGFSQEQSEIDRLQRKLDEQKQQVEALMKAVTQSQPIIQLSQQRYQENDQFNSQLFKEIKQLKKQLKKIENGPQAPQFPQAPFIFPQQNYFQQPQPFQNPFQIPYPQYGANQNFQYLQPQYLNQQQTKQQPTFSQLLKEMARKKEEEKMNQLFLQLYNKDGNQRTEERNSQKTAKKIVRIKREHGKHSQAMSLSSRPDESPLQTQPKSQKQMQINKSLLQQQQQPKPIQKPKPTKKRMLCLMQKFKLLTIMIVLYQRKKYFDYEKKMIETLNQEVGTYDEEFLFNQVIIRFFQESNKQSAFKKSWIITEQKDIPARTQQLILMTSNLLSIAIKEVEKVSFTPDHIKFIKIFTKNLGTLFSGHSAFVAFRMKVDYKKQIKVTSKAQSQMAFLEYAYIQTFICETIFSTNVWIKSLPNYAEALKILVSLLQWLFVDKFSKLLILSEKNKFNTESAAFLDFSQRNFVDIKQNIKLDVKKGQINDKAPILGLYDQTVLKPVLDNPGYAKLMELFTQFCDLLYSKIGYAD